MIGAMATLVQAAAVPGVVPGTAHLAFPVFDWLPRGAVLWPVEDERHAPHLQPGEHAVIDPHDTAIAWGELYLVRQHRGPVLWQVAAVPERQRASIKAEGVFACLRPLNRPRVDGAGLVDWSGPVHMSDGPVGLDYLAERILGRLVGVYVPRGREVSV